MTQFENDRNRCQFFNKTPSDLTLSRSGTTRSLARQTGTHNVKPDTAVRTGQALLEP